MGHFDWENLGRRALLAAVITLGFSPVCIAGEPAKSVRVDLEGMGEVNLAVESVEGGDAGNASWAGAKAPKTLSGAFPAGAAWKEGSITFVPSQTGKVLLFLKGPFASIPGGSGLKPVFADFDEVSASGAEIANGGFEKNSGGRRVSGWGTSDVPTSNPPVTEELRSSVAEGDAKEGVWFARVWHNSYFIQYLEVQKDVPVTLRFSFRLAPEGAP